MIHNAQYHRHDSKKSRRYLLIVVTLSILGAILLCFLIREYASQFRETFSSETAALMDEIAQQATLVINDRVDMNLNNMETVAISISRMKLVDSKEIAAFLKSEAKRYGYSSLSIAGVDGIGINSEGDNYNVSTRKHFLSALKGENAVSGVITSNYKNADSIEFAVPIKVNNSVKGALLAGYNLSDFGDILQVSMFGGQGSALVIDSEGIVIVNNGVKKPYNFYYYLENDIYIGDKMLDKFKDDISRGKTGTLKYSHGQTSYMMHYQTLGINDWSLLILAPTDSISQKTNMLLRGTTYIGIAIGALVAFLMMIIILMQYRNRKTLEDLLYVDPVTEGASQAKFDEEAKIRIVKKECGTYAMVQMNIEKFKLINTTFGRKEGDRILRHVYKVINEQLASDEIVARFTADRFCMLLHYHSQEAIIARLSDICDRINKFNDGLKSKYILQFNEGICVIDEADPDISILYERANFARTHGENRGARKGTVLFYDELERSVIFHEKEIENHMEEALVHGEFEVYLQPKYEIKGNTVAGAEALVRWNDPQRGLVFPNDFIPIFEKNGFVVKLDIYVFEQICNLLQKWHDEKTACIPISVNLSRVHLDHLNFFEPYRKIYSRYTFPSNLIEIELTESIMFDNMERLCKVIDEIHETGFECSMDDFGSGYSSLNMLKDVPVDTLKLDRAFFYSKTADNDVKSRYVIENVINLAQKLSMKTVSEGVETLEQVEHLRKSKCEMVQGYVFAKPMPISNFERLLAEEKKL